MNAIDLLPPVLTRQLRAAKAKMRGPVLHFDAMGRRLEHRGSAADLGVMHQVFWDRNYDMKKLKRIDAIQSYYESLNRPQIIDAGANIGASAVWFAQTYPKAAVTAIEPHVGNYDLLVKNTEGLRVESIQGAIASRPGKIRLFDPGEGEWGFRTGDSAGLALGEVPAMTVEQGVSEFLCLRRSETCPRRRASLATNDRRGGQVGVAYYAAVLVNRSA